MGFLTDRDSTKTLFGYVYITTNKINGKQYIGRHKSSLFDESYKGSGKAIRNALKRYGSHNFRVEVLDWCYSNEELNEREHFWILYYKADKDRNFYNINPQQGMGSGSSHAMFGLRGKDNPNYGSRRTEEQKRNIHNSKLGIPSHNKGKHAINDGEYVKYVSDEEMSFYLGIGWEKGTGNTHNKPSHELLSKRIKEALNNPVTKAKKSNNMKGNTLGSKTKGYFWITNGLENKTCNPKDFEKWQEKGYHKGYDSSLRKPVRKHKREAR